MHMKSKEILCPRTSCKIYLYKFVVHKPNILMSFTQTLRQISSECKLSSLRFPGIPRAKQTKPNNSPSFKQKTVSYHGKNIQ